MLVPSNNKLHPSCYRLAVSTYSIRLRSIRPLRAQPAAPSALQSGSDDLLALLVEEARQGPHVQAAEQQQLGPASSPRLDNTRSPVGPQGMHRAEQDPACSSSSYVVVLPNKKLRPSTMDFEVMLRQLVVWKQQHLSAHVPRFCFDTPELGAWVRYMRKQHKDGTLEQWKVDRLSALSFEWELTDQEAKWHALYHQLRRHQLLYGTTKVDISNSSRDGCDWQIVAKWLHRQGRMLAKQKLSGQKKAMLAQLGVTLRLPRRLVHRTAQLQALNGPERRKLRKKWKKLDLAAAGARWRQQQEQRQQQQAQELQQQLVGKRRLLLLLDAAQQRDAEGTAAATTSSSSSSLGLGTPAGPQQQKQQLPSQLHQGLLQQGDQLQQQLPRQEQQELPSQLHQGLQQQLLLQEQQELPLPEGVVAADGSFASDSGDGVALLAAAAPASNAGTNGLLQQEEPQQQQEEQQQQQQSPALQPLAVHPLVQLAQPQQQEAGAQLLPVAQTQSPELQPQTQRALFYQRNRRPWKRRLHSRQEKWLLAEQQQHS